MTLAEPTFGYNIDMHVEEVFNRARETHERKHALTSRYADQQIEVAPGTIIAASS